MRWCSLPQNCPFGLNWILLVEGGVGKEVEEMTVYIMEVFIETKLSFSSKSVPIMFVFKRKTQLILLIRGKLAETNNPLSFVIFHWLNPQCEFLHYLNSCPLFYFYAWTFGISLFVIVPIFKSFFYFFQIHLEKFCWVRCRFWWVYF